MKVKVLIFLTSCILLAQALPRDQLASEWEAYKKHHGKTYGGDEDARRLNIYTDNKRKIEDHNEKHSKGEVSYKVKINRFTDMLESEVRDTMNGYRGTILDTTGSLYVDDGKQMPTTVDWRNKGIVTQVKDQKNCQSCWAFSTTGAVEGQHALKTGKLISLSEQNLMDCSGNFGNHGCNGGFMRKSFEYIKANGGVDTEISYPYTAVDGRCHFNRSNIGATVTGHVDIPRGDENALKNAAAKIGPISVNIDATKWNFHHYSEGIYDEPTCSSYQLDHGVLVVGYGTENGKDYWLVKNSWGQQWGDKGYIKMTRNGNNQCGIATKASYPTV